MFYQITSLIISIAYPLLRLLGVHSTHRLRTTALPYLFLSHFSLQNLILISGLLAILGKWYNSYSTTQQMNEFFRLGKWTNATLFLFWNWKAAFIYVVVVMIHFCFVKQFIDSSLLTCDKDSFRQIVERGKRQFSITQEIKPEFAGKQMFLVEFYTNWAQTCINTKEIWNQLAAHFTTQRLKFVSVNVEQETDLAARYSISLSTMSRQLPTLVLIEEGVEKQRFPPIDKNGEVPRVLKYDKKELIRYFWLQERYLMTRASQ